MINADFFTSMVKLIIVHRIAIAATWQVIALLSVAYACLLKSSYESTLM